MITVLHVIAYLILAFFLALPWFLAEKPCPRCGICDWDKELGRNDVKTCKNCGKTIRLWGGE